MVTVFSLSDDRVEYISSFPLFFAVSHFLTFSFFLLFVLVCLSQEEALLRV